MCKVFNSDGKFYVYQSDGKFNVLYSDVKFNILYSDSKFNVLYSDENSCIKFKIESIVLDESNYKDSEEILNFVMKIDIFENFVFFLKFQLENC